MDKFINKRLNKIPLPLKIKAAYPKNTSWFRGFNKSEFYTLIWFLIAFSFLDYPTRFLLLFYAAYHLIYIVIAGAFALYYGTNNFLKINKARYFNYREYDSIVTGKRKSNLEIVLQDWSGIHTELSEKDGVKLTNLIKEQKILTIQPEPVIIK